MIEHLLSKHAPRAVPFTASLEPIRGIAMQHPPMFEEFAVRQRGLSADVGKTLEGTQSQIPKMPKAE